MANQLGETIRQLREKNGTTQVELAVAAQITQAAISAIELGAVRNPGIETIRRIAAALGSNLEDLIGDSNE